MSKLEYMQDLERQLSEARQRSAELATDLNALKKLYESRQDLIAEVEAALVAFHDSPAGDVNALSMKLEQAEAELAERDRQVALLRDGLLTVAEHHEHLNNRALRPLAQSMTLKIVRDALAASDIRARTGETVCPVCGKPAHLKRFLGACGPWSTWPNHARAEEGGGDGRN